MNKLSCRDYKLLISRSVDNDLNEEELIDLNNHIDTCKNCYLHNKQMTSLKHIFNNVGSNHFIHFFHIPQKRKTLNFLKYASVVVASVFLFVLMFSIYSYIDKENYIAQNYNYYYDYLDEISNEYYPMSTFIFYENINSKEPTDYENVKDSIYTNNGYFQYMMPINY